MTLVLSEALQAAIYTRLAADSDLAAIVGDAIFDAEQRPSSVSSADTHVSIGSERVRDKGSATHAAFEHDFDVVVHSAAEGFATAKRAAAAVVEALTHPVLPIAGANLVCLSFLSTRAERAKLPERRRVTLRFRALLEPIAD